MMNDKEIKTKKPNWSFVAFGALYVAVGAIMIVAGVTAYKSGTMIPATMKSGPMTGLQSIVTGVIASGAGSFFVGYEVFKALRAKRESNKVARPDQ